MCNSNFPNQDEHNLKTPFIPLTPSPPPPQPSKPPSPRAKNPVSDDADFKTGTRNNLVSLVVREATSIAKISLPMVVFGLILYCRPLISMIFLGRLGDLSLAGGALAIGFANITGYSVLSGLAIGMEPICGQAFGAKKPTLLCLALQRTIILLLFTSIPISIFWANIKQILIFFGQDINLATQAQTFLVFSIPDLLAQSFLHPLRIYLRSQSITTPLTVSAAVAVILHIPINYFLVWHLDLGIKGVALSGVWTNFNLVAFILIYVYFSGVLRNSWGGISNSKGSFDEWRNLLNLAIPSCVSVCLEWWWYEIMILLCGLLINPKSTVASMGILIQTTGLIYIFPSSLSSGVSTRVGNELGANRPKRARLAAIVGLCFSFVIGFSALFFSVSVRNLWARVFTDDKEILALTAMVLPVIGLCELGNCPQTTGCGILRGTARPKIGANINLASFYLIGMPVAVILSFYLGLGFRGLWFGMLAAQSSCLVSMLMVFFRTDWNVEAKRAQHLTGVGAGDGGEKTEVIVKDGEEEENLVRGPDGYCFV